MSDNSLAKLKKIKFKQLVYPSILVIFCIGLGVTFWYSTKFLSSQLVKIFGSLSQEQMASRLLALDLENYQLVAKKLNFWVEPQNLIAPLATSSAPIEETATTSDAAAATSSEPAAAQEVLAADQAATGTAEIQAAPAVKAPLKISILNGTKTSGLAGELKRTIEAAGWPVTKIGNQTTPASRTRFSIKTGLVQAASEIERLKSLVIAKYPDTVTETLAADSGYDIEIVIGR